ncbi:MAG: XdhC family protein [Myxococcales bacterium]|nr:XdhC family protein [Myxococcales bacterium]
MLVSRRGRARRGAKSGKARRRVREIAEAILAVLNGRGRAALATVVRASGSTPQKPGARLLLCPDGTTIGTVGGGAIERVVLEALHEVRSTREARLIAHDLGHDLGMCCGGRMEVFVESIEAAPRLFVFGAGHVGKPTAALARSVGFDVTVVDDREDLNTEERFPGCERVLVEPPDFLRRTTLTEADAVLVVTHDHALDEKALDLALEQRPGYMGLVASRRKAIRLLGRIEGRRGPLPLSRVYAPVGLDLGALTPEEIAVSIVAELVALRRGRPAAHSRIRGDEAGLAGRRRDARGAAE